jgi:uroporphyrinogen-III synthase
MRVVDRPLDGVTVAIPESRFREEFATLFERAGASVRLCPLMTETILEDKSSTRAFIDRAVSSNLDITIFMTGIGTNLILQEAESIGKREALLAALARETIVSRGSKSTAALRKAGIRIDWIPETATTEGLIDLLAGHDLHDRQIAVQLYGTPNPTLVSALESRGAHVFPISVYTYSAASDPRDVESFIRNIVKGEVQIMVFTSAPQVHALFDAAAALGLDALLRDNLGRQTEVASIGEVTSRALQRYNVRPQIVPDEPKMGPMVRAICTTRSS